MPRIEYVTNVTTFAVIDATGAWTLQGGFPQTPDEVVIKQITYSSTGADVWGLYLISSNLNQSQFIGAVTNAASFTSNPGTTITVRNPLPNVLTFQLLTPSQPPANATGAVDDIISISMDFIKYR